MQVDNYQNYKQMKIKLQSNSKLQLVKAVKEVLDLSLKEAKDLVDEQEAKEDMRIYVIVDSEKTEEQIKTLMGQFDVTCTPLSDIDFCESTCNHILDDVDEVQNLNDNATAPESANYHEAEQKLQKVKLQEVTDEDLGVSIHSIDEMSIGWQCKILFNHKQATRVLVGLHDAKFNVTEALVMCEGNKATMLIVTKTFPTGTRKKDLVKFEKLLHAFICAVCKVVDLEERIESAKERAIEAFDELRDYE